MGLRETHTSSSPAERTAQGRLWVGRSVLWVDVAQKIIGSGGHHTL